MTGDMGETPGPKGGGKTSKSEEANLKKEGTADKVVKGTEKKDGLNECY